MKIIIDSGSTKSKWILIYSDKGIKEVYNAGINPYFQNRNEIIDIISQIKNEI